MQVSVGSIVSVLFFPPRDIPNKAAFVSNFLDYTKVFDADPMILPIGNAPPPVPRIAMKSRDGRYACEVALDRMSFTYQGAGKEKRTLDSLYPPYRDILHKVIVAALASLGAPIVRLGFVTRHLVEIEGSSNEWMRESYLRADRLPPADETHLNFLHRLEMESFKVNRWIRIRTLREKNPPHNDTALAVEIDINTLPDRTARFDRSAIVGFFLDAFHAAQEDLQSYVLDFFGEEEE